MFWTVLFFYLVIDILYLLMLNKYILEIFNDKKSKINFQSKRLNQKSMSIYKYNIVGGKLFKSKFLSKITLLFIPFTFYILNSVYENKLKKINKNKNEITYNEIIIFNPLFSKLDMQINVYKNIIQKNYGKFSEENVKKFDENYIELKKETEDFFKDFKSREVQYINTNDLKKLNRNIKLINKNITNIENEMKLNKIYDRDYIILKSYINGII